MSLESEKRNFLQSVQVRVRADAIGNCMRASLQHNPTYLEGNVDRTRFSVAFSREVIAASDAYRQSVGDTEHALTIQRIADNLSRSHGSMLQGGGLRIGTVQKALNLYLKIVWCLENNRPIPPHWPVDRIVLQSAGIFENWTALNSIEKYGEWIAHLRNHARDRGQSSLAEWELCLWSSVGITIRRSNLSSTDATMVLDSTVEPKGKDLMIPNEYLGHWTGLVDDSRRKKPYRGEVMVATEDGRTKYMMSRGDLIGSLSVRAIYHSAIDLDEQFDSGAIANGVIRLSIGGDGTLDCKWRDSPKSNIVRSTATMRRC